MLLTVQYHFTDKKLVVHCTTFCNVVYVYFTFVLWRGLRGACALSSFLHRGTLPRPLEAPPGVPLHRVEDVILRLLPLNKNASFSMCWRVYALINRMPTSLRLTENVLILPRKLASDKESWHQGLQALESPLRRLLQVFQSVFRFVREKDRHGT